MSSTQLLSSDRPAFGDLTTPYDIDAVRADFPILSERVHGHDLVYLDNAATTQKPRQVIDTVSRFYAQTNANIHRGVHQLSQNATDLYEEARATLGAFINANEPREIVFVRGATEAINLAAWSFARQNLLPGDQVIVSAMEHHSNIVPWQMICQEQQAELIAAPINDRGELQMDAFDRLLNSRTKLVAVTHVSNALGTVNPIQEITRLAHRWGATVLVDGAQAAPHVPIDVQELDCDFYAFSGHKMYGPTGIGVLYGKADLLETMPPYQFGGDMIRTVSFERTTYASVPHKFEAGTPNIAGAIGLGAAARYLMELDLRHVAEHEENLLWYATDALSQIDGLRIIGEADYKTGVVSFVMDGVHPHDIGTILDREGVAVRTGHHCAQPLMKRFNVPATTRLSFGLYNTCEEIDAAVAAIRKVKEIFHC